MSKLEWDAPLDKSNALQLDQDMNKAMEKLNEMEEIVSRLHGLDCGSCGAPSCMALAEDVVRGFAQEEDCIFNMKEQMEEFLEQMADQKAILSRPLPSKRQGGEGMTVKELTEQSGFGILCPGDPEREISKVYCCDMLSIAMGRARRTAPGSPSWAMSTRWR